MSALPNLVVIGAMKCGTTSLHEYLSLHPDIGMSDPKEVDFFSGGHSDRPLEWYTSLFDAAKSVRGESSQNYTKGHLPLYAGAPERMAELIPAAKLIYLVRDPIKRYSSHVAENVYGELRGTVSWALENDHYVKTGLYYYQLSFFLKHYPLDQVLVVDLDDLMTNRLQTMNEIFEFLGVGPLDDAGRFDFIANVSAEKPLPYWWEGNPLLRAGRRFVPGMTDRIIRSSLVQSTLLRDIKKAELSNADRAKLAERFRPDVDALRKLVGRKFAKWSV